MGHGPQQLMEWGVPNSSLSSSEIRDTVVAIAQDATVQELYMLGYTKWCAMKCQCEMFAVREPTPAKTWHRQLKGEYIDRK